MIFCYNSKRKDQTELRHHGLLELELLQIGKAVLRSNAFKRIIIYLSGSADKTNYYFFCWIQ
jgi:hypothetical protein